MKYFLCLLLVSSSIVYAGDKISAPYDDQCDNKIETFHKVNDLEISDRYKVSATLKLNQSTDLYILDRTFSSNKSDSCQYSDQWIHNYIFIVKNKNHQPIIYNKLLSDLDFTTDIYLKKNPNGFSISIWYGQSTTVEAKAEFKITPKKGIFLMKITTQSLADDKKKEYGRTQKFPQSKKYELSNIVLSDFF